MKNLFKLSSISKGLICIFLFIVTITPNNVLAVTNTKTVKAIDGRITVTFKYALTTTPKITDFVVTQSINKGTVKAVKPTKITMDSTKKIATLAVPTIVKTTIIQNVVYKVSYKKDTIVSSPTMVVVKAIKVTKINLNKTTDTLTVGGTVNLIATVTPTSATNKAVTWKSSNNNIAKVDSNGKVTAVSAGTATITVTTVDGSKTLTCTVKVNNPIKPVVIATVKTGLFGSIVNATSTQVGVTKYQIFDGKNAISAIANLGTPTTIYPAKVAGNIVTIKLLNAAGTIVATTDVTLVASVK